MSTGKSGSKFCVCQKESQSNCPPSLNHSHSRNHSLQEVPNLSRNLSRNLSSKCLSNSRPLRGRKSRRHTSSLIGNRTPGQEEAGSLKSKNLFLLRSPLLRPPLLKPPLLIATLTRGANISSKTPLRARPAKVFRAKGAHLAKVLISSELTAKAQLSRNKKALPA